MSISRISNKVSRMSPIIVESKLLNNVMNNYRKPTKIDFVSDLHIEMWDPIYKIKYPCGNIKNYPLNMDIFERSESRFLIVGGDISDDLELTIDKLSEISNFYDKVLFIDGNHEHVNKIPMNYEKKYIQDLVNEKNKTLDNKLHYLSSAPYKIGSTLIVGKCGWWDYNGWDDKTIKEAPTAPAEEAPAAPVVTEVVVNNIVPTVPIFPVVNNIRSRLNNANLFFNGYY